MHPFHEVVALEGGASLARVQVRDSASGASETHAVHHLFLMTGAAPNTQWLQGCVALDDKGFVKTSPDLGPDDLAGWPLARPPYLLETSRAASSPWARSAPQRQTRRLSGGQGSICVQMVHRALND